MVDWNDKNNRKKFREALEKAYPDPEDLELFVDEALNENLNAIANGSTLRQKARKLISWARTETRIDELWKAFKDDKPRRPEIAEIESELLVDVKIEPLLPSAEWTLLFSMFIESDLPNLKKSLDKVLKAVKGFTFQQLDPGAVIQGIQQIQDVLERRGKLNDGPRLAVRFVEFAIAEIRRSDDANQRNLTLLQAWRDRIAQQFQVPPPPTVQTDERSHAYLLVVLELHGADVNVYPELRVTGTPHPISFGASTDHCAPDEVAERVSDWIQQAEESLDVEVLDDEEVTLEVFLPAESFSKPLYEDIATDWVLHDERNRPVKLGNYRRFIVRSTDRIRGRKIQSKLKRLWGELEACATPQEICDRIYVQEHCPTEPGHLSALLKDNQALGLKFMDSLPSDPVQRADIIYDVIDSGIPIALWSSTEGCDRATNEIEFDHLLTCCSITNFAELARQWRRRRLDTAFAPAALPIRMLCDRPDRLPRLPDPNDDNDALVAS